MRLIKIVGLVALAAMGAMAFVGASSASANNSTALCNEASAELKCPDAQLTTTLHGTASEPLFHTSIVDVKCTSSLIKISVLSLGNPQVGHLEELTWSGCKTHGGTNCTVVTLLIGLFNVLKLSTTDAHARYAIAYKVKCGETIDCVYGGEPTLLVEGSPADLKANTLIAETPIHGEKFLCPNTSTFLALYTNLSNIYVRV